MDSLLPTPDYQLGYEAGRSSRPPNPKFWDNPDYVNGYNDGHADMINRTGPTTTPNPRNPQSLEQYLQELERWVDYVEQRLQEIEEE